MNRIWILTKMQLSNKMDLRIENKKRLYAKIALRALVIVIISIVMSLVLHLFKNILYIPINTYFMIFVLLLTQGLSIISTTSGLLTDLYDSKDNSILLSLPANNDEIFFSKLLVYYIGELLKNLYLVIPLLIGYGAVSGAGVLYYINILPMVFILPLLSVLISSLFTIPIVYIKYFLNSHQMITFILFLLLLGAAFYITMLLVSSIPIPIRIVQLYNRFILGLTLFMQASAKYATIYAVVGYIIGGVKALLFYGILVVTLVMLLLSLWFISRPLFFSLASKSSEFARTKVHKKEVRQNKSLYKSFLLKEWKITSRSVNEVVQNYAGLFALPFIMYVMNYIYMGMNRSTLGNNLVLVFNIMITLLLVMSSNTASASAISKEGSEFVLLKTAPSDTSKIAWAKMTINLVLSFVLIFFSFLLFGWALPVFPKTDIWYLFLFVVLVNSGHIVWSFQLDILSPKLNEYAATQSLSSNTNVSNSISIGFVLSLLFGSLAAILFIFVRPLAWPVLLGLGVGFLIIRFILFNAFLKAYFLEIEF